MAWINKILYKAQENAEAIIYNIGTTFDNVRLSESNIYSLQDLKDSLNQFFSKQSFMHYSTQTPPDNSRYMEWYCLEGESTDLVSDKIWDPNESLLSNPDD